MASDEQLKERVDAAIEAAIRGRNLPAPLADAMAYAALGPGKRTRPLLCLRSCEAVGGEAEAALAPAVAIELVHAFSLVHDDLPAMDDDDLRRGRPTLHRHAGEALAILAGDALLSLAVETVSAPAPGSSLDPRLPGELAEATTAMIAGQVLDTVGGFPEGVPEADRLESVHLQKTAALLRAACRMGAICGGASPQQLAALGAFANGVGLCFQAVDDLLDVTADAQTLGKATGKDADAGKLTYPGLYGVDGTRERVRRLSAAAVHALKPLGHPADRLAAMAEALAVRGS